MPIKHLTLAPIIGGVQWQEDHDLSTLTLDEIAAGAVNKHLTVILEAKLNGIEAGAEVNNISDADVLDLTDGGSTTLHTHPLDHAAVTLDVSADTLLSLAGQQLGLDTQTANRVFAGPSAGIAAVPTFRALVAADIPALSYGDISGTGVVGQVAEFVTNTKTLQAAKLIAPTANILTLTNAAASTLALNITAAKTLTLTAADNYTLTVPESLTVAGRNVANTFIAAQFIDGSADAIQLRVQGHSTQNSRIATWENSSGTVLVSIGTAASASESILNVTSPLFTHASGSTRYGLILSSSYFAATGASNGNLFGFDNSMIIYASSASATGTYVGGNYVAAASRADSGKVVGTLVGLRNRVYGNTSSFVGGVTNAYGYQMDIWGVNGAAATGTITNLYGNYFNSPVKGGGTVTNIYGMYMEDITVGATLNYVIYTNKGLVRFGDQLEIVGAVDRNQLKVTGFTTQTLPVGYLIDNTAATNTVRNVLQLETQSTGTAADGLGAGLLFSIETATASTMQNAGQIAAVWATAANATRKADLIFSAYDTIAREGIRISADGTGAVVKLSGGQTRPYVAKTADYVITDNDYVVDVTANNVNITLLTAVGRQGRVHQINNSGSGTVTLLTTSSQTINGDASGVVQLAQWEQITVMSNGANWIVIY